jgi:hypothetical protein
MCGLYEREKYEEWATKWNISKKERRDKCVLILKLYHSSLKCPTSLYRCTDLTALPAAVWGIGPLLTMCGAPWSVLRSASITTGCISRVEFSKSTNPCCRKTVHIVWDFKFSRQRVWSSESSGMCCRVVNWNVGRHSVKNTAVHPRRFWASEFLCILCYFRWALASLSHLNTES